MRQGSHHVTAIDVGIPREGGLAERAKCFQGREHSDVTAVSPYFGKGGADMPTSYQSDL
jgi:hypothetical protein